MQEQPELCYVSLKKGCPVWYSNLWTERRNSAAETEKCKFDINKHVRLSKTNFTNIQEHLCPVLLSTPCKYKQFSFQKSVFRLKFWVAWLPIQEFSINSPFLFTESNKKEKPFVFSFEGLGSMQGMYKPSSYRKPLLMFLTLKVLSRYSPASTAPISRTPSCMGMLIWIIGLTPLPVRVIWREVCPVFISSTSWN